MCFLTKFALVMVLPFLWTVSGVLADISYPQPDG
jgi:hypothetical protein